MHDARTAAAELERCVRDLGFKGALVNGHTGGVYCDDPRYDALWEVVQALDVPFYLHPVGFHVVPHVFGGHPELEGAAWGWGVDTGTHALRMLFAGIFDRFPELKIVLGHMGEALPFLRWRFDSRFAVYTHGVRLERKPSDYFGRNILITTTGVCSDAALAGAIGEIGTDAVMFSVDYPYESIAVAADWIDAAPLDAATKAKICHDNAARLLKLPT
jgi:2,3-dihydroxybenzoate decarboxylase